MENCDQKGSSRSDLISNRTRHPQIAAIRRLGRTRKSFNCSLVRLEHKMGATGFGNRATRRSIALRFVLKSHNSQKIAHFQMGYIAFKFLENFDTPPLQEHKG